MARQLPILENGEYCWSSIGVFSRGSPTCPTLEQVIHCQNCAVYTSAGRNLFDRVAPSGYAEEWTRALRQGKRAEEGESLSLLVFRIGSEWLALETTALRQVSELKKVHSLPHRTDEVLLGVVNIRGQIQLCCSLASLLGLPPSPGEAAGSLVYRRMIVAESASDRWVFAVDEVDGVRRFRPRHLRAKPVTVAKHHAHLTRSIVELDEDALQVSERGEGALPFQRRQVGYLDHERVFAALRAHVFRGDGAAPLALPGS